MSYIRKCLDFDLEWCDETCTHREEHEEGRSSRYCDDVCDHNSKSKRCRIVPTIDDLVWVLNQILPYIFPHDGGTFNNKTFYYPDRSVTVEKLIYDRKERSDKKK